MFLIIQNDPECPPGTCSEIVIGSGLSAVTIAAYGPEPLPDPARACGVIVLGGEMGVHDTGRFPFLDRVRAFMARAIEAGTPLLAICLGGQLLADVAGGVVTPRSAHGEKGVCQVDLLPAGIEDPLFAGVPGHFTTFQLHSDSFTPPAAATLLASSAACPAQAFRLPGRVYGLQFHPEVDRSIVSAWGSLSTPPVDFLSPFVCAEIPFNAASKAILRNFVRLASDSRRP